MVPEGTAETRSVRRLRSMATSCVTLTAESFGNPEARRVRRTFPGASAQRRLVVKTATITVRSRLSLTSFD